MSSDAELHAAYKVANAPLNLYPYPHFFVQDVFPEDYYAKLQAMLPDPHALRPIEEVRAVKGYKERFVLDLGGEQMALLPDAKRAFWTDLRQWLSRRGTKAVVPNKSNRKQPFTFDRKSYAQRHRIENAFCRLKDFRRIATRYDRLARNFLASVCLVAAILWWTL